MNSTMEASVPLRHTQLIIVILFIAYLTVLVLGLVGNFLVIAVVVKIPKIKTGTKYFILNLAIADLLVLLFCLLPNLIANIYVPWVMGSFLCKAVPYVQGVSVCASVYSLVAISADRLMAIRSPLRRQVTKSVARIIIALIWIWAAVLAVPWLLHFELVSEDGSNPPLVFCIEVWPPGMNGNTYFVVVNLGLCYLFPLSFISFCHLTVWLRVRRPQLPTSASVCQRNLNKRAKASVEKMVLVVVAGFAACWLPLYVIFVRIKLIPAVQGPTEEQVLDYALPIAQWLGAANSCMNSIVYAYFNRNFRFALQRLLSRSAYNTSNNHLNRRHHNQGAWFRRKFVRLRNTLRRRQRKNVQLKNAHRKAVDSAESTVVTLQQDNPQLVAVERSQTYQADMSNPWCCVV